jgi:hypothetical protein
MAHNVRAHFFVFIAGVVGLASVVATTWPRSIIVCTAARSLYGDSSTDGYSSFDDFITNGLLYLETRGPGYTFMYKINSVHPSYQGKQPSAKYADVSITLFGNVGEVLTMTVPLSEMEAASGKRLDCATD